MHLLQRNRGNCVYVRYSFSLVLRFFFSFHLTLCQFFSRFDRSQLLCQGLMGLIELRFPYARVVFAKPATSQPDTDACGIMSAAYATMIVQGEDPRSVPLKLDPGKKNRALTLRAHFRKILAEKRLEKFPSP